MKNKQNNSALWQIRKLGGLGLVLLFIPFFFLGLSTNNLVRYYANSGHLSYQTESENESESEEETAAEKDGNSESEKEKEDVDNIDGGGADDNSCYAQILFIIPGLSFFNGLPSLKKVGYSLPYYFIRSLFPSIYVLDQSFLE